MFNGRSDDKFLSVDIYGLKILVQLKKIEKLIFKKKPFNSFFDNFISIYVKSERDIIQNTTSCFNKCITKLYYEYSV